MGVKKPLDFRFPQWETSYTQGGSHLNTAAGTWQTAVDFSNNRGTMYLRHTSAWGQNRYTEMRVTIDGVAYPIYDRFKAQGNDPFWIFDFNESVKVEHKTEVIANESRVEWAYYTYRP